MNKSQYDELTLLLLVFLNFKSVFFLLLRLEQTNREYSNDKKGRFHQNCILTTRQIKLNDQRPRVTKEIA